MLAHARCIWFQSLQKLLGNLSVHNLRIAKFVRYGTMYRLYMHLHMSIAHFTRRLNNLNYCIFKTYILIPQVCVKGKI